MATQHEETCGGDVIVTIGSKLVKRACELRHARRAIPAKRMETGKTRLFMRHDIGHYGNEPFNFMAAPTPLSGTAQRMNEEGSPLREERAAR
ncbi:hypothetical protein [Streptomyces sp. SGAir0957]